MSYLNCWMWHKPTHLSSVGAAMRKAGSASWVPPGDPPLLEKYFTPNKNGLEFPLVNVYIVIRFQSPLSSWVNQLFLAVFKASFGGKRNSPLSPHLQVIEVLQGPESEKKSGVAKSTWPKPKAENKDMWRFPQAGRPQNELSCRRKHPLKWMISENIDR